MTTSTSTAKPIVTRNKKGHVYVIGINRPDRKNAFNLALLRELSSAFGELENNPELRVGVLFAHGDNFTSGLDLKDVAPAMGSGESLYAEGAIDPLGIHGPRTTKPVICAVQGLCLTIGIELMLASDIAIAADNARFAQIEIKRGIFPFGGATRRWVAASGWGNAMRYLLTGDELDAETAYRIGMVQEVVPADQVKLRAIALAETVAAQAPLGVAATLRSARLAMGKGVVVSDAELVPEMQRLMASEDAREGVMSFIERREAKFVGR